MNRAAILAFSDRGTETAARIAAALTDWEVKRYRPQGDLKPLTAALFSNVEALVFVGACGIAVRAIAPHIANKAVDPAVLVVDERGEYVIALLSGHIGGANELARSLAVAIGATPVVTTATDVNRRFSADAWAARRGLLIEDMAAVKRFSTEILKRDLPLCSDFPIKGALPPGLYEGDSGDCGLLIACRAARPFDTTLLLAPRILHVGVGCRRGIGAEQIGAAVESALASAGLCPRAVASAATIDIKRNEAGLTAWADNMDLPLAFYSADELNAVPGDFTGSEFVRETVGTDSVCERAAMLEAGDGARLIARKTALDGVTVAVAVEKWSVCFE